MVGSGRESQGAALDQCHCLPKPDLGRPEGTRPNNRLTSSRRSTFIDNKESYKQISCLEHFSHA